MNNKSSVNPHYTFKYSQPTEYRFSHDSVFLARQVFERLDAKQIQSLRALDLCSGCGIIGLDFIFHCQNEYALAPLSMDFLEVQEVYRSHFEANLQQLPKLVTQVQFIQKNYNCLQESDFFGKYDLILCNPPYFFVNNGVLSPSEFKNRCRFFIDSDFESLLIGISKSLARGGQAFLLLRDLPEHKWNSLAEAERILKGSLKLTTLGFIRGTHLIQLVHNSGT